MDSRPSQHDPENEIPEKNWFYRFAKKHWFFGFGAKLNIGTYYFSAKAIGTTPSGKWHHRRST